MISIPGINPVQHEAADEKPRSRWGPGHKTLS
jgi:hypothetical protein